MARLKERGAHTFWQNDVPLTDIYEALALLAQHGTSLNPTHLRRNHELDVWEIRLPWYREGDSGGDTSGTDYFQIADATADELVKHRFVEPHREKFWGGSRLVPDMLVVSTLGKETCRVYEDDMRTKAEALLVPGTHTDLTGEPCPGGSGREHWRYGALYFDFRANDRHFRVFPEAGTVSEIG